MNRTMNTTNSTNPTDGAAMLAPLLHMNGSSAETLIDGYTKAHNLLDAAIDALRACAPNGRDYYPQGPAALMQAVREHDKRIASLCEVLTEIELLAENVNEQRDARAKP